MGERARALSANKTVRGDIMLLNISEDVNDGDYGKDSTQLLQDWPRPPFIEDASDTTGGMLRSVSIQFYAGGKGNGAQPHWHGPAWNWLLRGAKRWQLWPPHAATYAQRHVSLAVEPANAAVGAPLECEQRAGDVLVLPALWGHATVNTAPSIGFATELNFDRTFDLGLSPDMGDEWWRYDGREAPADFSPWDGLPARVAVGATGGAQSLSSRGASQKKGSDEPTTPSTPPRVPPALMPAAVDDAAVPGVDGATVERDAGAADEEFYEEAMEEAMEAGDEADTEAMEAGDAEDTFPVDGPGQEEEPPADGAPREEAPADRREALAVLVRELSRAAEEAESVAATADAHAKALRKRARAAQVLLARRDEGR